MTSTPYATLEERHAAAGLSHVGSPHRCEASRTCALVSPASRRGATAPRSSAARMPGRKPATASSAFVPVATVPMPRASRERGEHVDQLGLAEEAAVAAVGAVALALHLVGLGREQLDAEPGGEVAGRVALDLGQRVAVAGRGHDAVGPERTDRRREQERAVRAAAVGDHDAPPRLEVALQRLEPGLQQVLVEPRGELRQALEHHVGPGVLELLAGAAAGQHADAQHAGRAGAVDVVHVVADVDARRPRAGAPRALPTPQTQPSSDVDVEAEVVDVPLGVGGILAGHDHDPAAVPAYGGERLVRAGQDGDDGHGVLGVQRPEPVPGGLDLVGRQVRRQHLLQRRPEPAT